MHESAQAEDRRGWTKARKDTQANEAQTLARWLMLRLTESRVGLTQGVLCFFDRRTELTRGREHHMIQLIVSA